MYTIAAAKSRLSGMKRCPSCQSAYPTHYTHCPRDGSALAESAEWSDGTIVRGKYQIMGKVGQGGMAAVYKAMHVRFKEPRALKVINPELANDANFVRRFEQEAIITRKLQHPNAVRVDDIDEAEDGRPFIVMEYIEGRNLKDVIEQEAPMPVARVCSIVKQVAAALDAAHRLGLVHRDIKPANIALVRHGEGSDDPSERVKVLDFGIAKLKEAHLEESRVQHETLTGTGMVIGTPAYMSPEQAKGLKGEQFDGRSDLYSLGVVAYQMLTGDLPLKADSTLELLMAHINTPPKPIQEVRPDLKVPAAVATVVMRCLEKNRQLRPACGQALVDEIDLASGDRSCAPHDIRRPVPSIESSQGAVVVKKRTLAPVVVTVSTVCVLLVGLLSWSAHQKTVSQRRFVLDKTFVRQGSQPIQFVKFSPDNLLLAASSGHEVSLWDVINGGFLSSAVGGCDSPLAFSQNGKYLGCWVANNEGTKASLSHWRNFNGRLEDDNESQGSRSKVAPCCFATGYWSTTIRLWTAFAPMEPKTLVGHAASIRAIAFAQKGDLLASGSDDGIVKIWDVATGIEIRTLRDHTDKIYSLVFSPDGRQLASSSGDGMILWDVQTGARVWTILRGGDLRMAFNPDGRLLAVGYNTVSILDAATGRDLETLADPRTADCFTGAMSFSPDGQLLAVEEWFPSGPSGGVHEVQLWRRSN